MACPPMSPAVTKRLTALRIATPVYPVNGPAWIASRDRPFSCTYSNVGSFVHTTCTHSFAFLERTDVSSTPITGAACNPAVAATPTVGNVSAVSVNCVVQRPDRHGRPEHVRQRFCAAFLGDVLTDQKEMAHALTFGP